MTQAAPASSKRNRIFDLLPIAVGIVFLLGIAWLLKDRALRGQNDFVQLYTGAKLAGTPDLYSHDANLAVVQKTLGFTMETVVYTRPPFYAVLLKPLAAFPYLVAYALFSLLSLASAIWFVARFSKECSPLPFFAALSVPLVEAICTGQDTPFLLPILGGSILLTRRNKDFLAGLVISLCAIKFHLFLFLPLLFVMKRRWRILGGALCGTALLTLLGVAVAGPDSILKYVGVLRSPSINFAASAIPNLHGLVAVLHGDMKLELGLVGIVLLAFFWIAARTASYEALLGVSLVCGLLVSFHSGVTDDILLLVVFMVVYRNYVYVPLRVLSALLLTPVPYLCALADAPYSAVVPIALLILIALFGLAQTASRAEATAPVVATA
jgi:hypothetical protein